MNKTGTAQPQQTLPETYFEWVRRHPLKSIQTDAELDSAQAFMDELLRKDLDAGGLAYPPLDRARADASRYSASAKH